MRDLTELDKLQKFLQENKYNFRRQDVFKEPYDIHQVVVYDENDIRQWDAVVHHGSFGAEKGLLEVMGSRVVRTDDTVEGWLTAQDIIDRLKEDED